MDTPKKAYASSRPYLVSCASGAFVGGLAGSALGAGVGCALGVVGDRLRASDSRVARMTGWTIWVYGAGKDLRTLERLVDERRAYEAWRYLVKRAG